MSKLLLQVANALGQIRAGRLAIITDFKSLAKCKNCQKLVVAVNTLLGNAKPQQNCDLLIGQIDSFNKDAVNLTHYKKVRNDLIFKSKIAVFEAESKNLALFFKWLVAIRAFVEDKYANELAGKAPAASATAAAKPSKPVVPAKPLATATNKTGGTASAVGASKSVQRSSTTAGSSGAVVKKGGSTDDQLAQIHHKLDNLFTKFENFDKNTFADRAKQQKQNQTEFDLLRAQLKAQDLRLKKIEEDRKGIINKSAVSFAKPAGKDGFTTPAREKKESTAATSGILGSGQGRSSSSRNVGYGRGGAYASHSYLQPVKSYNEIFGESYMPPVHRDTFDRRTSYYEGIRSIPSRVASPAQPRVYTMPATRASSPLRNHGSYGALPEARNMYGGYTPVEPAYDPAMSAFNYHRGSYTSNLGYYN